MDRLFQVLADAAVAAIFAIDARIHRTQGGWLHR